MPADSESTSNERATTMKFDLMPNRQNATAVLGAVIVLIASYVLLTSFGGGVALAIVAAYFAPTIVAAARKVPNQGSVLVVNTFLGWTLIGWVVALAMAARSRALAR
jgi:hypothetical protein